MRILGRRPNLPALRYLLPIVALGLVFILTGWGFYTRSQLLMKSELQDRLRVTASLATGYFDPAELDRIRGREDLGSDHLRSIVSRLEQLKATIPNVRYVYLMRQTSDENTLEFIADSDTLKPPAVLDVNHDGTLEPNEEPSLPGDPYDVTNMPALRVNAFSGPAADDNLTQDQWGSFFSGYAPIRRSDGSVAAIIGIDVDAASYGVLINQVFSPFALLLFVMLGVAFSIYFLYVLTLRRQEMQGRLHEIRSGILQLTFHQLGAPLTAFKWSLEILKDHASKQPKDEIVDEHIRVMEDGIGFMMHLVNDLERADRIRSGHLAYDPKLENLSALIQLVADEYRPRAVRKKQTIRTELPESLVLPLDHDLIAAVLRELLDNALIYSPSDSEVTISLRARGGFAEVSVSDRGIGIPHGEADFIFAEFGRASNAGLQHPSGSGLALFIAKGVVERAGGEMMVMSEQDKGSTFTFTLPLH